MATSAGGPRAPRVCCHPMQPRNYAALCLLGAMLFFERLAFYFCRGTAFVRLGGAVVLAIVPKLDRVES
jgi:hypothetical protein